MNSNDIKIIGLGESLSFVSDISDDIEKALSDGRITKQEALQLFGIVLRHAVKFGINLLSFYISEQSKS